VAVVAGASPLLLALALVDEDAVPLGGVTGGSDRLEAGFAADRLAGFELRALLREFAACCSRQACSRRSRSASCSARCCLTEGGATRRASLASTFDAASSWGSYTPCRSAPGSPAVSTSRCASSGRRTAASASSGVRA